MGLPARALIVDDDAQVRGTLAEMLEVAGHSVRMAARGDEALALVAHQPPDVALLDIRLPDVSGIDLLRTIKTASPEIEVILITGYASLASAVQAIDGAAFAYLEKPLEMSRLLATLEKAIEKRRRALQDAGEHDIGARRRAEAQLRLQSAALDAAANAIVITDRDGQIVWVNAAFTELTGYRPEEALGRNPRLLDSGRQTREFFRDLWETVLSGAVWHGELVNRRKDGSLYREEQTITPVRDDRGDISHFIAIKQDISERERAEAEIRRQRDALLQRDKLAAMGELLAGVAHELNNPLSVVTGHATLLYQTVRDSPLAERVKKIADAAARCARIVKNFLALARQYPPERSAVDLNAVVREAVELLAYQLRVGGVEVALDLAPDLPALWADAHQLQQVLVNLVTNAEQAMRESQPQRRLTITTRSVPGAPRVELSVADTGPGVPPEIRSRIFEPFFTTKAPGQGTGLGLSLCHGIVEEHRGTIRVEGAGAGAVFVVDLPVEKPPETGPGARAVGTARPPSGKAILVVDDEPDVAQILADLLAGDGHRVETAPNGLIALRKLEERPWDLILSDVRMPELDGLGLHEAVRRRYPALTRRFVFITGDALSPSTRELLERTGAPSITKPFAPDEIGLLIRQVLQTE